MASRPYSGDLTITQSLLERYDGQRYELQYKPEAGQPPWTDLDAVIAAVGSTATFTDSTIGAATSRTYRVQVLP